MTQYDTTSGSVARRAGGQWGGTAGGDAAARLVPVLARAVESGRGPAGLVNWVRARLGPGAAGGAPEPTIRQLASELARVLGRGAETIAGL